MPALFLALVLGLQTPSILSVPTVNSWLTVQTQKDVWQESLHQCENPNNIPWIIDSNGLRSYGRFQWQLRSWLNYKKQGATKENISDDAMQDKITRYVLDTKGSRDWYWCTKKLGAYPIDK